MKIGEFLCHQFVSEDGRKCAHFWHIMLYYFKEGKNTTEMQKKTCAVYGECTFPDRMCQKWFVKLLGTIDILAK